MNSTFFSQAKGSQCQSDFENQLQQKANYFIPILPNGDMHHIPNKVRRSLKLNKHRGFVKKGKLNPQQEQIKQSIRRQQSQKLNEHLQIHQIFNYLNKQLQQKVSDKKKNHQIKQYKNDVKLSDKMIYIRRKLSPLKKGNITQYKIPILDQKMKKDFLNIQKLELINLYNQQQQKNVNDQKIIKPEINNNISQMRYYYKKKKPCIQGHKIIMKNTLLLPASQNKIKQKFHQTVIKFKNFQKPFEKYYYRDFLWKIAFSNHLTFECPQQYEQKIKVYIGKGNNSMLIRSLVKRRTSWWIVTDRIQEANFAWTQIKSSEYFSIQQSNNNISLQEQLNNIDMPELPKNKSSKNHSKIMNRFDIHRWNQYYLTFRKVEQKMNQSMKRRNKLINKPNACKIDCNNVRIHNHLTNNYILGNKKALFYTMSKYYELIGEQRFNYLPLTFHIKHGLEDQQYLTFLQKYYARAKIIRKYEENCESLGKKYHKLHNVWIIKPGQFSNRGNGISVCLSLDEIKKVLRNKSSKYEQNLKKTYILQSYLDQPFLYYRRKIDLRHFMMITSINGKIKGYWYQQGYIRTTSYEYNLNTSANAVHLTNDAVQKTLSEYGRYQKGNKISYDQFQIYLNCEYPHKKYNFKQQVYPIMKKIATDSIKASALMIDPSRKEHNFELFGLDFLIDSNFKPWLIQINNNPCLQISCPLLKQIIPKMIENCFKIAVDSLIPPPCIINEKYYNFNEITIDKNKFQLVYDSEYEEHSLQKIMDNQLSLQIDYKQLDKQQDQIFQDEGHQIDY